jgi:hypothetical protein
MAEMSLQVVLELVNRLTGPAREAVKDLEQFGAAARKAGSADAGLRPDKWVEEGRAIIAAAEQAKRFEASAINAAEAEKKISGAPWMTTAEAIDKATAALKDFNAQLDAMAGKKLPGAPGGRPGPGGKEEPSGVAQFVENATEMTALFEGPKAIETIIGGGAHLTSETIKQKIAGMSPKQIEDARALAVDLEGKFPQFTLTDILKEVREARSILTSDEEVRKAMGAVLKSAALADQESPGQGLIKAYPLLRAVEEGGFTKDWARAQEVLNDFQSAKNAMGDKLDTADYFHVYQRGGAFARDWDEKFLKYELPHIMASFGGDAAGVMFSTLGEAVLGGHMMGPALDAFDKLGLLDERNVERDKAGHIRRVQPGGVKGADVYRRDPVEWTQRVLWPAVEKATSDPTEQFALMVGALGNRNELKAALAGIRDTAQFQATEDLIKRKGNLGLDAADLLKGDPTVGWQAAKSSIETLAGVAFEPAMKPLAAGLDMLASSISGLSRAAANHPIESTLASGGALAAITYWLGKGFIGVGQKLGFIAGGSEGAAGAEAGAAAGGARALGGRFFGPFGWALAAVDTVNDLIDDARRLRADFSVAPAGANAKASAAADPAMIAAGRLRAGLDASAAEPMKPKVDASEIERASDKAKQASADLKALGQTVKPKIDASPLDALIVKLREAASLVTSINGGLSVASHRASFAGALHDGPEAR